IATKPNSAYREARIAVAFWNARLLQERQRATTGTYEYEFRFDAGRFTRHLIADGDIPTSSSARPRRSLETLHSMQELDGKAFGPAERVEQCSRQCTVVDISAGTHSRGSHDFLWIAPVHDQGEPLTQLALVVRILHSLVARTRSKRRVSLLQEIDIVVP